MRAETTNPPSGLYVDVASPFEEFGFRGELDAGRECVPHGRLPTDRNSPRCGCWGEGDQGLPPVPASALAPAA